MRTHTLLLEHFNFTTQAAQLQTRDKRKGDEGSILEKDLDLQVTEEGQALCLVLEQNLGPPDCLLQARLYSNKQFVVRNFMGKNQISRRDDGKYDLCWYEQRQCWLRTHYDGI